MADPHFTTSSTTLRASDGDRERSAELLREHAAQGRLTIDELEQRLDRAYAARTQAELDALVHDLPAPTTMVAQRGTSLARGGGCGHADLRPFVVVNVLLIAIWALTGAGYFWPVWPLLGWGVGIAAERMKARTRSGPGIHRAA